LFYFIKYLIGYRFHSFGVHLVRVEVSQDLRDDLACLFVRGSDQSQLLLVRHYQRPV